jgi:hypothetical protein
VTGVQTCALPISGKKAPEIGHDNSGVSCPNDFRRKETIIRVDRQAVWGKV